MILSALKTRSRQNRILNKQIKDEIEKMPNNTVKYVKYVGTTTYNQRVNLPKDSTVLLITGDVVHQHVPTLKMYQVATLKRPFDANNVFVEKVTTSGDTPTVETVTDNANTYVANTGILTVANELNKPNSHYTVFYYE